jgi:hypothetical protein
MNLPDTVTVIRARRGKRLAKTVHADGVVTDYDAAYTYDLVPVPVANLGAVAALLADLMPRQDCAAVRGVPVDPTRSMNVRRLAYADRNTGDPATLEPTSHRWLALDMDHVDRPDAVPAHDLMACARLAVSHLPAAFEGAEAVIQATASHGIKPGCRLRLWYWLDRPTTDAEATRWLRRYPVDLSVFRTVQPIYTAAPHFLDCTDHLPARLAMRPGQPTVAVPPPASLAAPPRRRSVPLPSPGDSRGARYAFAALTHAATRIQRTGEGGRHAQILAEARALGRFIEAGLLTINDVQTVLYGAGAAAGKPEREVSLTVAWGLDHAATTPLPDGVRP